MIINLNDLLSIMLYISLIVLIIIFIVLGIRLIRTMGKVNKLIDDVNEKMNKVDGVFDIIDKTTGYASNISEKITGVISSIIGFLFKKKGNDENE